MSKQKTYQGIFNPVNKEKYTGNINNIVYRSGWEHDTFMWLDMNPKVKFWASEKIAVPYIHRVPDLKNRTITQKMKKYYVDLEVILEDKKYLIEIKPYKQTLQPTTKGKKEKTIIYEILMYQKNQDKWKYCNQFAAKYNYTFQIWTERELKCLGILK